MRQFLFLLQCFPFSHGNEESNVTSHLIKRRKELFFRYVNAAALRMVQSLYRRYGIRGTYCVAKDRIVHELDGVRYTYSVAEYGCTGNLDYSGYIENRSVDLLVTRLPKDGVFVDIGAHGGVYSIAMMKRRPDVTVHAFEPLPSDLLNNLVLNDLPADGVHRVAVGRAAGAGSITTEVRSSNYLTDQPAHGTVEVPVVRLDDEWSSGRLPGPDAIKVDIEGMEYFALLGAENMLRAKQPLIACEINALHERYYPKLGDFLLYMENLGYSLHRLNGGQMSPVNLPHIADASAVELGWTDDQNFWFVPKRSGESTRSGDSTAS